MHSQQSLTFNTRNFQSLRDSAPCILLDENISNKNISKIHDKHVTCDTRIDLLREEMYNAVLYIKCYRTIKN